MVSAILVGAALLAAGPGQETLAPPDLTAYEAAKADVGRDPDAHVRLALWCEAHGLQAERVRHLALAVLNDPSHAMARGLMGLVAYRGRWQRPEAVGETLKEDAALNAALAEYNARRERTADTADAQWRLALWCEEKGLKAEASAHLAAVVRLDPSRDAAWRRLGCKTHNGRWMTEAQIAAEKGEIEARKKGDEHWKPRLTRWRGWLGDRRKDKRDEAERALGTVTDPYAVPSIWAVFVEGGGGGGERGQARAVQMLGQIDAPRASRALALLAVFSDSAEVRRTAIETLRGRDTREFLGGVIGLLRPRVKYEVRPVGGPGTPGVLFVAGERFNVQRLYAPPPMPNIPLFAGEPVTFDAYGLPVISRYLGATLETKQSYHSERLGSGPPPAAVVASARRQGLNPRRLFGTSTTRTTVETTTTPVEHSLQIPIGQLMLQYQTAALVARQQQLDDIQVVDNYNAVVGRLNDRATEVLRGTTGEDLGEDSRSWSAWWVDQLGYAYKSPESQPVPTFVENVPLAYLPPGIMPQAVNQAGPSNTTTSSTISTSPGGFTHNCFKAGTPVRTLAGPRAIETIRVGDQVLTQDVQTGALSYQPVLAVFHNRPGATLRIELEEGESIVATTIHRFWKAGQGWVMARDLKPGDPLRTLGGTARVRAVESDQVQPVFNLQVAEGGSFFVGAAGTLAHDNSVVEPVTIPFDAPPKLATLAAGAK